MGPSPSGAIVALVILSVGLTSAPSSADGPPPISFTAQIAENAVSNSARVGSTGMMYYPRIAIDRHSGSPYYGTIYVIGLSNLTCASIVVSASVDGGRSFGEPRISDLCLPGPSADVVIGRNGTVYLATWGPEVLRFADGGLTWENLTILDNATSPASLGWDPVTGDLYATWTSPRGEIWGFHPSTVLLSTSRDEGRTWTAPRSVLPAGVVGDRSQVAAYGGRAVVALLVPDAGGVRVAAVASGDAGGTWGNVTSISRADPCNVGAAPSIAASDAGLFAVSWYEAEGTHASGGDCGEWGTGVRTFVSLSLDGGASFSPEVLAGGPPGWLSASLGDALAFDDRSRVYVTWHSIMPNWSPAYIHVAVSDADIAMFDASNFTIAMSVSGGNSTQQENLVAGPGHSVYLLWEAFASYGAPLDGIFVRRVAGEISGDVELMPGVPNDVPIMVEFRGADVTRIAWNGSRIVLSDVAPEAYAVNVTWGNYSTAAGVALVRAWGVTAFVIRVGGDAGPSGWLWWLFVIPVAGFVVAVVYVYSRESKAKRER